VVVVFVVVVVLVVVVLLVVVVVSVVVVVVLLVVVFVVVVVSVVVVVLVDIVLHTLSASLTPSKEYNGVTEVVAVETTTFVVKATVDPPMAFKIKRIRQQHKS